MTLYSSQQKLIKTARTAGFWYLLMAVSGLIGFLILHPQIFNSKDSLSTLTNIIEHKSLARTRLLMEFVIIVSQALTGVWFYRLFRTINPWAAWAVGIWGMVNSIAIMISAISIASAIDIASASYSPEDKVLLIELLSSFVKNSWGVGSLFFGLWLIPLGYIVTNTSNH